MREQLDLTEADGYEALRSHCLDKALGARERYCPRIDAEAMLRILQDPDFVRRPTTVVFSQDGLLPGEFGHAAPAGEDPADGYQLTLHPAFADRPEDSTC